MRHRTLALAGLAVIFLCAGCGQQEPSAEPAVLNSPTVLESVPSMLPEADPSAQTLTVARMERNRFVTEVINTFNDANTGVQAQSQWFEDREGELKLSLIAGDGPDLMSLEFFDYEIYAAKGVFTDLYPLLNADPDLSREDLVEPVLRAMEYSNGALYQMAPSFHLSCMFTCPDTVDPSLPWNLDTVETWMAQHPDALFTAGAQSPSDILSVLLQGYLQSLVDYETMTCDFTSGLFQRMLEDSNAWAQRPWTGENADAQAYSSGALLGDWCYLRDFSTYQQLLDAGLATPSGFPSEKDSGVYAGSVTRFAICSGTGREDLAWAFLKIALSPELQEQAPWLPMLKRELEARARAAQQEQPPVVTEVFVDPEGAALGTNSATVRVTLPPDQAMDTDAVDQMLSLLDLASGCRGNSDANVTSIIYQESESYFSDGKPPEEVAKIIQNRVEIYLSEHA